MSLLRLFLILCFLTQLAQASERENVIKVIVNPFPAFSQEKENGEFSGYSVELTRGIFEEAGLEAEFIARPFARMISSLDHNPSVVGATIARTPERESRFYWITTVTAKSDILFVHKDSPLAKGGDNSTPVESVAVMRDDYRVSMARDNGVKNVMEVATWDRAVEAVIKRRVDGLLFSELGLSIACEYNNFDCTDLVPVKVWGHSFSYIVLPKTESNADIAQRLTEAAKRYKRSDAFQRKVSDTMGVFSDYGYHGHFNEGTIFLGSAESAAQRNNIWVLAGSSQNFSEVDNYGNVIGYNSVLVKTILINANIDQEILIVPWTRIIRETSQKPNVLAFAVTRTEKRENLYHWITPLTYNLHGLFGSEHETYRAFEDIDRRKVVGAIKGDFRSQISKQEGLTTKEYNSFEDLFSAFRNDEIDLIFTSESTLESSCLALNKKCDDIRMIMPYKPSTTWLVLSKNGTSDNLVQLLKRSAQSVKQSNSFKTWSVKWASDQSRRDAKNYVVKDGVMHIYNPAKNE